MKPCPWCGKDGNLVVVPGSEGMRVVCHDCDIDGPQGATYQDAVSAWDERAGEKENDGEVKPLDN